MGFFQRIKDSIYNPQFYQTVPTSSFGKALGYILLYTLILAFISTINTYPSIKDVQYNAPQWVNSAVNYYPQELQVDIQNGQVTTNVQEPYFIPLPGRSKEATDSEKLLVIDTKTPFSSTQMHNYNTLAWLTKDSLFYMNDRKAKIEAFDLHEVSNLTINKNLIQEITSHLQPYYHYITPVLTIGAFLFFWSVYQGYLFYLLIVASLIWLLSRVCNWGLDYGGSYKVGMYALTLPLLINVVKDILSYWIKFPSIPFFFTLILLAVVYFNLRRQTSR